MWADRVLNSKMAEQAVASGAARETDLRRIAEGWRVWASSQDGWLSILHGEIVCRVTAC